MRAGVMWTARHRARPNSDDVLLGREGMLRTAVGWATDRPDDLSSGNQGCTFERKRGRAECALGHGAADIPMGVSAARAVICLMLTINDVIAPLGSLRDQAPTARFQNTRGHTWLPFRTELGAITSGIREKFHCAPVNAAPAGNFPLCFGLEGPCKAPAMSRFAKAVSRFCNTSKFFEMGRSWRVHLLGGSVASYLHNGIGALSEHHARKRLRQP